MRFTPEESLVIIMDVQGRLAEAVHEKNRLFRSLEGLIAAARLLDVPILVTEQAPEKIGKTVPVIAQLLAKESPIVKSSFSGWGSPAFVQQLTGLGRKNIVLAGIETHVCVYQTAADLLTAGYRVKAVTDAVSSRQPHQTTTALQEMRDLGAQWTTVEMMICEWVRDAGHPRFKEIIRLLKK